MNRLNLQLFAEGDGSFGNADGSADATSAAFEGQNAADKSADFKSMINGEYKDEYQKHFEKQLNRRLKASNKQISELEAYKGKALEIFDRLAIGYGIDDPSDIDAIYNSVKNDQTYIENYAMKNGVDTEAAARDIEAKRIIAQRNKEQQAVEAEKEFKEKFDGWLAQAEQLKEVYPDFDFDYESTNEETGEKFRALLNNNFDVQTAYTVLHINEIMGGAMNYAFNSAKQEMAEQRAARMQRPVENGQSEQQPSSVTADPSKLTKQQREKIKEAVNRGEKVNADNIGRYL